MVTTNIFTSKRSCPVFKSLTWHEPAIQSKNQHLVSSQLQKKHLTSMSCKVEPTIWSRDIGQRIPCFDRCQLIITWMPNIIEVHSKPRLHVSLNPLFGVWPPCSRLSCRCRCVYVPTSNTTSHDNHEFINSWVSFCFPFEYGAFMGLRLAWAAGAPL